MGNPGVEASTHPAAQALRDLLAQDNVIPPREGWRVVVLSETDALFLLPATPDEGFDYWNAEFHRGALAWEYVRSGQCDLMLALNGLELARWERASDEKPAPSSRTVSVMVTELGCASGKPPAGRIVQAAEAYLDDLIVVILGTRPLPGPQTCEPGPPSEFTIELDEPLGDRMLIDGSNLPSMPQG